MASWHLVHLHYSSQKKSQKESQNIRIQGFSYYFCVMIEGSGPGSRSIPLTSGSGSVRSKNMWIRIRNTAWQWDRWVGGTSGSFSFCPCETQKFLPCKVVFIFAKCGWMKVGTDFSCDIIPFFLANVHVCLEQRDTVTFFTTSSQNNSKTGRTFNVQETATWIVPIILIRTKTHHINQNKIQVSE